MVVLKCKMCGANLETEDMSVIECDYCGSKNTLPNLNDERKVAFFDRANFYRSNNEFDKASLLYENIVVEAPDDAEAYWGICLCKYGIEYVEDPRSKKRVPTCHRTQFKSILEDSDYKKAYENADTFAKVVYKEEAEYIDAIQKRIIGISTEEEPFDIFICYKQTDDITGERTVDSLIAEEIYNELIEQGYKVFFSMITLEDKLGIAYEPYIFAALNSAMVMIVVGTKREYFESVWVKNEWMRYLKMIEEGQKKVIIPCYRDMSVYDLPDEFISLQSQDMSRIGCLKDISNAIQRIVKSSHSNRYEVDNEKKEDTLESKYNKAITFFENAEKIEDYSIAKSMFKEIISYKDSESLFSICCKKEIEEKHILIEAIKKNRDNSVIACDSRHIAGVKSDGTVFSYAWMWKEKVIKKMCDVSKWENIVAVDVGTFHTIGLRSDGTVIATKYPGRKYRGQCEVSKWKNIVAVSTSDEHTVGLKADGTVIATKYRGRDFWGQCNVSGWKDIVAIYAGDTYTIGLKENGKIEIAGEPLRMKEHVVRKINKYSDIVAIDINNECIVGLRANGTVVVESEDDIYQESVLDWKNIVAVSLSNDCIWGLKKNGNVVVANKDHNKKYDVSYLKDINAINKWMGVKEDGTLISLKGERDIERWIRIANGKLPKVAIKN